MADRFPLIVNSISKKIEELVSGDNLDLTGNGIVVSGDTGAGKYLTSDGSSVSWGTPGDVFLTASQTLTNKQLVSCTISGSTSTLTNIPNSALVNSSISVNGTSVSLGGSITTPNDNTTYTIAALDGASASQKIIRLSDSTAVDDDIIIGVTAPTTIPANHKALELLIDRTGDTISISGTVLDADTITTLQAASGGTAQTGAMSIAGAGIIQVIQDAPTRTITISANDQDTKTKLRVGLGGNYGPADGQTGNYTFLSAGATTVTQGANGQTGDPEITISSTDTVTRLRGGTTGTFTPATTAGADITITGGSHLGGNVTVQQTGNTIEIDSTDTNTVTRVAAGPSNALNAGDFRFVQAGDTTVTQNVSGGVTTITISSVNTDTGASLAASGGLILNGTDFQLKNAGNLAGNTLVKWDSGNGQLTNSLLTDDGSTVTIGGDLVVDGTQTILNTTTLQVEDNLIELRKGPSITAADGGIQVNLTTDANENVVSYQSLQWYNSGGYWRSWDGSVDKRLVNETDFQTLTNKTLNSPTLTAPILGAATATSINGLAIANTVSSTLTLTSAISVEFQRDVVFTTDNALSSVTTNFRQGGNVAYTSDTLATFAPTTSTQLRTLITDTTGTDRLVFQNNPNILNSITTSSTSFNLIISSAVDVNFANSATNLNMGATSGTTTINNNVSIPKELTVGTTISDAVTINGTLNSELADIEVFGTSLDPITVGRGNAQNTATNTAFGVRTLGSMSSGSQNTGYGYEALRVCNVGAANTAFGNRALRQLDDGTDNTAVGRDALLLVQGGSRNVAIGNNALESTTSGNNNICIGYYAGYAATGDGNVLIGSSYNGVGDATYQPDNPGGDNQLVISSGSNAWIKGDSNFDITIENDLSVSGSAVIAGNLTVNGTTTTINSNILQVDDKTLELGAVLNANFNAVCVDQTATITGITPTDNVIPGMVVNSVTGGISVPTGTKIVTVSGNTATLDNLVTGSGTANFLGQGPSDTTANGGGIVLKGTVDKTILYDDTRTEKYWTLSENLEIALGKRFAIGNQLVLDQTTLGTTVINSSLETVGTLERLTTSGFVTIGGRVIEKVFQSFNTTLTPSANTLTINVVGSNTICGQPTTSAINTWAFITDNGDPTNPSVLSNGQSITVTLILTANTAATYGDACTVDGVTVSNGVQWSGGSPPISTSNTDILTFILVKDNSGVLKVFGQGNTDFS